MKTTPDQILRELLAQLDLLFINDDLQVAKVSKAAELTTKAMEASKQYIRQNPFTTREDEIHFFKNIKPELDGRLIYFLRLPGLVLKEPVAGAGAIISYYQTQQQHIDQYFAENREFYVYYRMGHNYLDHIYFTRDSDAIHLYTDNYSWMMDTQTNSPMSGPLAMIKAYELSASFIANRLWMLTQQSQSAPHSGGKVFIITWTASKSALVELIVALQEHGVFNNTRVPLKRLSDYLSIVFNVKLGNVFKIHEDNRLRKKGRKPFLDSLGTSYLRRLEYEDENSP